MGLAEARANYIPLGLLLLSLTRSFFIFFSVILFVPGSIRVLRADRSKNGVVKIDDSLPRSTRFYSPRLLLFLYDSIRRKVSRSLAKTTKREPSRVSRACSYRLFHRQRKTGEQAAYRLFRSNDFVIHTCTRALEKLRARSFFFSFRKKPFSTDQNAITKRQLCDRRNTQKKQEQVRCGKGVMGDLFCLRSCLKNETLDWMLIMFKRQRKIVEPFDR